MASPSAADDPAPGPILETGSQRAISSSHVDTPSLFGGVPSCSSADGSRLGSALRSTAHEKGAHRVRRTAKRKHQISGAIGGGLRFAGIGAVDEKAAEQDQRSAAGNIAEEQAQQE